MPYMLNDQISQAEIEGGIEITDAKYSELLSAKMAGKIVTVKDGQPFIYSGDKRTVYQLVDNQVVSQGIQLEDDTPAGWQDIEPTPVPEPPQIPQTVSRAQGIKACYNWAGEFDVTGVAYPNLLLALNALHDSLAEGEQKFDLYLGLNVTNNWERQSPTMQSVCTVLGLTDSDLDELFTNAAAIVV